MKHGLRYVGGKMAIAIVTGASSGLGREYITAVIEQFPIVDEIWLIARRKEKLKEIAEQTPQKTIVAIALDLSSLESFDLFEKLLREREPEIKVLINAAGYGQCATFFTSDRTKQAGMIDLNCRALTVLTRICLPYMIEDSLVVNVASIAALAPAPRMSVYAASKAFVDSLSKALRQELLPRGINVISVCPGPMDTEFFDVAYEPEGFSKKLDALPRVYPRDVAVKSLKQGRRKKAFYTKGFTYKLYHVFSRILPESLLMRLVDI